MDKSIKYLLGFTFTIPLLLTLNLITQYKMASRVLDVAGSVDGAAFSDSITNIAIATKSLYICLLLIKIYGIYHVLNNSKLNKNERLIWILLFVFVAIVAGPIYWFLKISKEEI